MKPMEELAAEIISSTLTAVTQGKVRFHIDCAKLPEPLSPAVVLCGEDFSRCRRVAIEEARRLQFEEERVSDLATAVSEAAMNAQVHGGGGTVAFSSTDDRIQVIVIDRGPGIPILDVPNALFTRGWSTKKSLGMGFPLIIESSDYVDLCTGPFGTRVVITKCKTDPMLACLTF